MVKSASCDKEPNPGWTAGTCFANRKARRESSISDISAYCDFTTAKKALILLSGPEDELSMKGYMAVRKWIDESIAGYEMRAGDIPYHPGMPTASLS
jgi:cell division GTPase FtsZ